jgi:hypothetical protein
LEYSLNQKKAGCISLYYDKLPMCEISKPNESPSQRYPCDGQTDKRTDECEFIGHRFVKPVTNKGKALNGSNVLYTDLWDGLILFNN